MWALNEDLLRAASDIVDTPGFSGWCAYAQAASINSALVHGRIPKKREAGRALNHGWRTKPVNLAQLLRYVHSARSNGTRYPNGLNHLPPGKSSAERSEYAHGNVPRWLRTSRPECSQQPSTC